MITVQNHGGNCCGVTHLYLGETGDPESLVAPVEKFSYKKLDETGIPRYIHSNDELVPGSYEHTIGYRSAYMYEAPACSLARPEETAGERAKALLTEFKNNWRTGGIIEAVITHRQAWGSWLEEQGFKRVASARNANSTNVISFYVLAYGANADVVEDTSEPPEPPEPDYDDYYEADDDEVEFLGEINEDESL